MTMGQAYDHILTPRAQKALEEGCDLLLDEAFNALGTYQKPEDLAHTIFGELLPERYLYRYTPLFLRQFTVCLITVAWKLAQPGYFPLSSVAEELAANAIIKQAMTIIEEESGQEAAAEAFDTFIDAYFEDMDFELLFENSFDGVDETPVGQMLGMSSLAFDDWFRPFSDEPSRIVHPYVVN